MEPATVNPTHSLQEQEEDEWDTDGFVIPSLEIEDPDSNKIDASEIEPKPSSPEAKKEEKIYLGPHGAPPQHKQQELANPGGGGGRKQRLKQKIKEADRRSGGGSGRENKLESLQELVGIGRGGNIIPKSSAKEWLDPHCHESDFERR